MSRVPSIHRQVLAWALGALALGAGGLILASWWLLQREMGEVFENNLKQVALAVAFHHGDAGPGPQRLANALPRVFEEAGQFDFVTAVWSLDGRLLASSDRAVHLPFLSRSGLSQVRAGGEPWYLYTVVLDSVIVQAAQRVHERELLARSTTGDLALVSGCVLALAVALVAFALRRGLMPLRLATSEVARRSAQTLHPIAVAGQPAELHPLVDAINGLMAQLDAALTAQRHFMADAAHELRTPITALRLQVRLVERASNETQRRAALAELHDGIDRSVHVVERLLQLSRVGPDAPASRSQAVPLDRLVREAVARFHARAEAQHVDLGATSETSPVIEADPQQIAILLDNLVDNALRHVPEGGRIDVAAAVDDGDPCLVVSDNGPGIPAEERERVFDRFYRGRTAAGYGSGLGLAIVKAVAERHHARVTLDAAPGGGLRVTVRFAQA